MNIRFASQNAVERRCVEFTESSWLIIMNLFSALSRVNRKLVKTIIQIKSRAMLRNKGKMMKQWKLALGVALMVPAMSFAAGDAAAGKAKSAVCAACHGANGKALIPTYPSLAGQNAGYLVEALKAYRGGQRNSPQAAVMKPQAATLSDQDIANLAAYYSSLK